MKFPRNFFCRRGAQEHMHLQTGVRAPIGERIEREVVFTRATCGYSALAFSPSTESSVFSKLKAFLQRHRQLNDGPSHSDLAGPGLRDGLTHLCREPLVHHPVSTHTHTFCMGLGRLRLCLGRLRRRLRLGRPHLCLSQLCRLAPPYSSPITRRRCNRQCRRRCRPLGCAQGSDKPAALSLCWGLAWCVASAWTWPSGITPFWR